jgi:hypothetical protein
MALEVLQKLQSDPSVPAGSRPALAMTTLQEGISSLVGGAVSGCYDTMVLQ